MTVPGILRQHVHVPLCLAVTSAVVVVVAVLIACACGGGPSSPTAPGNSGGSGQATPVLTSIHSGWKSPRCSACHTLPVTSHQVSDVWRCAQCHGANGACNPNGRPTVRQHSTTDTCVTCHQQTHQFTASAECVGCHFAASGTVTCQGPSGPGLPGVLQSGCFGWPGAEFSPSNKASVTTFLRADQASVDFVLRDPMGAVVRLADLLQSKPVLLVHGSFT